MIRSPHSELFGQALDQILAEDNGASGVFWDLTDDENSVRDVVQLSGSTAEVIDHLTYGAFGNLESQTNAAYQPHFTYTGQELDAATGLYYYNARYYDPVVAKFLSEDPKGFAAGDANLYRYVGNSPFDHVDPTGMNQRLPTDKFTPLGLSSTSSPIASLSVPSSFTLGGQTVNVGGSYSGGGLSSVIDTSNLFGYGPSSAGSSVLNPAGVSYSGTGSALSSLNVSSNVTLAAPVFSGSSGGSVPDLKDLDQAYYDATVGAVTRAALYPDDFS